MSDQSTVVDAPAPTADTPTLEATLKQKRLALSLISGCHVLNHLQYSITSVIFPVMMKELGFGLLQLGALSAISNFVGQGLQVVYGLFTGMFKRTAMLGTGNVIVGVAVAGICAVLVRGLISKQHASELVTLSLMGFLLLPSYAFAHGHPFRMRYMVALVVTVAAFVGIAVGLLKGRVRTAAAVAVAAWLAFTVNPLDPKAPMVQEAQWDRPFSAGRREVTNCLMREYHHEPILASMGSLAHYMQELSHEGLGIHDFIHEGNLPYWQEDIEAPKGRVKWILIEEQAEGGDVLAQRARASSEFLSGFTRVCSGGGVALYKASK